MIKLTMALLVSASCHAPAHICDEMNLIKDLHTFAAVAVGSSVCESYDINMSALNRQLFDLAIFGLGDSQDAMTAIENLLDIYHAYNAKAPDKFCEDVRKSLGSYSPEYLRWYGIID